MTYECETTNVKTQESCGFLDYVVWEDRYTGTWYRRWCVFKNAIFTMYNFPSDKDIGGAVEIVDMRKYPFCSAGHIGRVFFPETQDIPFGGLRL